MTEQMNEAPELQVDERVVLEKFEGEAHPDNVVERLVVSNGFVVEHVKIENGEVVGPAEESLEGKDIGRFVSEEEEVI